MKSILRWFSFIIALLIGMNIWSNTSFAQGEENAYKLKPKYLVNNSNFEMMSATVTEDEHHFSTVGNFRTSKDFDVMYWEAEDVHSHPTLKYPTDGDFSDLVLEYNYALSGDATPLNGVPSPTLTIVTTDNKAYYIRLWNYVVDRPVEDWEKEISDSLNIDYSFPVGREEGEASGTEGKIRIDFNNLYAGWVPFVQAKDSEGNLTWIPNPEWVKVPVTSIKRLEWAFVPQEYDYNEEEISYFTESKPFKIDFLDWNVYGNAFLMNEQPYAPEGKVRISDGYDDTYNLTPERIAGDYARLGLWPYR